MLEQPLKFKSNVEYPRITQNEGERYGHLGRAFQERSEKVVILLQIYERKRKRLRGKSVPNTCICSWKCCSAQD